jgi:hypothetical protein
VTRVRVLISSNETAVDFPAMEAVIPDRKPLPRMVRMAPPEAAAEVGETVPIESGRLAS